MSRVSPIGLVALLTAAQVVATSPALAQSDPEAKAAAEVLFREGMAAFDKGDYAAACPRLQAAVTLTSGEALGGALLLARCFEKQGKTTSAWATYNEVAGKARAAGQAARAAEAEKAAAALLPRLHYLTLAVPPEIADLPGAQILRQGKPLRRELWTVRIPIDPGDVTFEVSAPGKRPFTTTVQIPSAAGDTTVTFQPLAGEPPPAPPAPPLPPATVAPAPPPPPVSAPPTSALPPPDTGPGGMTGPRVAGAILAVAGLAGVAAGIGLGAVAKGDYDAAVRDTTNCDPRAGGGFVCTDATKPNAARALGDAGTAVFFVGAGLAAGGALLFFLSPSPPRAAAFLPAVTFGRDGGALTWTGAF